VFAVGTMAVHSSVVALLTPDPLRMRGRPRVILQGFGAPGLRAPGLRRPFAPSRPLHPWAVARLTPRSFRHRRRWTFTHLSIGQHSPARAHRGRQRTKKPRTHEVRRPLTQARDRAVAPRSPRGAGQQPAGLPKGQRRPPYRAHWPVSGRSSRYRASCAPQGRGRNTPTHIAARRSPRTKHATPAG